MFLDDLEEYEYRKYKGYSDVDYLSGRWFLFKVKVYHTLYGQYKFPKLKTKEKSITNKR